MDERKGDLAETRTLDPLIKSQLLYQLSYGVINYFIWAANIINDIGENKCVLKFGRLLLKDF